jgi:type I restriction enzyme, R subunit
MSERTRETLADARLTADNLEHFGEPVYEYDMSQGIEDGYLAACEIHRFDLFHDNKQANERESGITRGDLSGKDITDAITGETIGQDELRERYDAPDIEDKILMPERVAAMTQDLFDHLLETGSPAQKTIIFCTRDRHADDVAGAMNNLYADWCAKSGKQRLEPYAFKCTASVSGSDYIADLRGGSRHHFIATTVDLLTTGVDVPVVSGIVFFKYVRSPIAFYQWLGAAHASIFHRTSSCSVSMITPTPPGCSERNSRASSRRRENPRKVPDRNRRNRPRGLSWWKGSMSVSQMPGGTS